MFRYRETPGGHYRCYNRLGEGSHYRITREESFYLRCRAGEYYAEPDEILVSGMTARPDERDAMHVAERLALLLNQSAETDINITYAVVNDVPGFLVEWSEDEVSYGITVVADADGVWGPGSLFEEKESTEDE